MQIRNRLRLLGQQCVAARRIQALLAGSIMIAAVLVALLQPTRAATDVQGRPDELQVQAENATVGEVLHALSGKFKLSYKLPPTITRTVTGSYGGTLSQVLERLLDGNDFIVSVSDAGMEVVVLQASGAAPVVLTNQPNSVRVTPAVATAQPVAQTAAAGAPPAVPPLNSFLSLN